MQILIFVGFKVVEILAFVFIPYGIGLLVQKTNSIFDDEPPVMLWFLGLVASVLTVVVVYLIVVLSMENWEWAGKLLN